MVFLVRCPFCHLLTLPLKSGLWRNVFRSNPPLGHEVQALARPEDAFICCRSHTPRLRDADGRNTERPQLDHQQHRRVSVQLVGGYVGSTPGTFHEARFLHTP